MIEVHCGNLNWNQLILEKNKICKTYVKENKDSQIFDKVECVQNKLNLLIQVIIKKFLSSKLGEPVPSTKS